MSTKGFNLKLKDVESVTDLEAPSVLKFHNSTKENSLKVVENVSSKKDILKLSPKDPNKEIKKKKYSSENYFSIKNHIDLFEVGKNYSVQVQNGKKSFAFYGDQESYSSAHTILGLSAFFNYHKNLKATIFVEKFNGSVLAKYLRPTHVEVELLNAENEEDTFESYACDGVEVIELGKLRHLAHKVGPQVFLEFVEDKIKNSELVFWDLPKISNVNKEREFYLPIINNLHSFTLVIDSGKSNRKNISEAINFAQKYQLNLEGALLYNKE